MITSVMVGCTRNNEYEYTGESARKQWPVLHPYATSNIISWPRNNRGVCDGLINGRLRYHRLASVAQWRRMGAASGLYRNPKAKPTSKHGSMLILWCPDI